MSLTIADTYYLKAFDLYPFDLDKVTEALNYAIGYDNEHAGAHYLFGMLNMYELGNNAEAENHFEQALASDMNHKRTYYCYVDLLIDSGEYERALKLIEYAKNIKGINKSRLIHDEGIIAEINGDLEKAKEFMESAYEKSYKKTEREFLKGELNRVKSKLKSKKKSKRE